MCIQTNGTICLCYCNAAGKSLLSVIKIKVCKNTILRLLHRFFVVCTVSFLDSFILRLSQIQNRTMTLFQHIKTIFTGRKLFPGMIGIIRIIQIGCDNRKISFAFRILVGKQPVSCFPVDPVLFIKPDQFRSFQSGSGHILIKAKIIEGSHLLPFSKQFLASFQGDLSISRGAVIITVFGKNHAGINN